MKLVSEIKRRALHLFIAVDQLAYVVITLGDGFPDETISSALYRTERDGKRFGKLFRPVVDFLFSPIEKDHCKVSYLAEIYRTQAPK